MPIEKEVAKKAPGQWHEGQLADFLQLFVRKNKRLTKAHV